MPSALATLLDELFKNGVSLVAVDASAVYRGTSRFNPTSSVEPLYCTFTFCSGLWLPNVPWTNVFSRNVAASMFISSPDSGIRTTARMFARFCR